jgi:hypothetical protein
LTSNEIQHLFAALVADITHWLRWSVSRRRNQARTRGCHYRQQAAQQACGDRGATQALQEHHAR